MDQVNLQGHGQQKMRQQPQQAAPRKYDGQQGNPLYDPQQGGHYGKSALPAACHATRLSLSRPPWGLVLTLSCRRVCSRMFSLRIRAYCKLEAADIWSRLPRKTTLRIRSCSPVPGRTYALTSVVATITQADNHRSTKDSLATTATFSTHTGSNRSRSSRRTNMTTSSTSFRLLGSRRS